MILDLHAAQGWQNEGWHSDNSENITLPWTNRDYHEILASIRAVDRWIVDHERPAWVENETGFSASRAT